MKNFLQLSKENQQAKIQQLQNKRRTLQVGRTTKPTTPKLPILPFTTQEHKIFFLQLPKQYQKLFV